MHSFDIDTASMSAQPAQPFRVGRMVVRSGWRASMRVKDFIVFGKIFYVNQWEMVDYAKCRAQIVQNQIWQQYYFSCLIFMSLLSFPCFRPLFSPHSVLTRPVNSPITTVSSWPVSMAIVGTS